MVPSVFCFTWGILVLSHVIGRTCDISQLILRRYCVCQNVRHWSEVVSAIFYLIRTQLFSFNFLALKEVVAIPIPEQPHEHPAHCSIPSSRALLLNFLKTWHLFRVLGKCPGALLPTCEGGRSTWAGARGSVYWRHVCLLVSIRCTSRTCTFRSLQEPTFQTHVH